MIAANSLAKQAELRKTLLGLLKKGEKLFSNLKEKPAEIIALKKKVLNENLNVIVLGSFKRGKSTFINALLGEEILPSYATPCTAVINEVKWGETKKAVVHFRDIREMTPLQKTSLASLPEKAKNHLKRFKTGHVKPLEIQINELNEYVVIKDPVGDSFASINDLPYDHVEIFWPLPLLKNGIVIIDSPGLDECESRSNITENYLARADAILYVQSCTNLAGQTEMSFIDSMLIDNAYEDTIFICNRFDEIKEKERDRIVSYGRKKLGTKTNFGPDEGVFFLSAFEALEGRLRNDEQLVAKSGIIEMERRLYTMLVSFRGKTKLIQPTRFFAQELARLTDDVHAKWTDAHGKALDLQFRLKEFTRHLEREIVYVHKTLEKLREDLELIVQNAKRMTEYTFQYELLPRIDEAILTHQPVNTIGLGYFFSEKHVRRQRIIEIGKEIKEVFKSCFRKNQQEMNQWLQAYAEECNIAAEDFISFAAERIADSIHRLHGVLEEGRASVDFASFNATPIEIGKLPKLSDAKSLSLSREKPDVVKTLQGAGMSGKKLLATSFGSFFLMDSTSDNDSYFHSVDEKEMDKMLIESGFPYDDPSKDTNELKMAIGQFLYNRLIEKKDALLEPHTRNWDNRVTSFLDTLWHNIDKRLDQIKKKAAEQGGELSAIQKMCSTWDTLLKEIRSIQVSLQDLTYDLAVS